jgi:hypothetical protein
MYKLIIKIRNGAKHELPLDAPEYNDLIDQIQKDNVHWVEEYINTEIYWYMRMNSLWDERVEDFYVLDPQGNRLEEY